MRRGTGLTGLFLGIAVLTLAPGARADDDALWALMKKPGHVVLLRHSQSPATPPDADKVDFKDCATQRNLDDAGRAHARRLGDAFRKRGIKAVRFVSSQYCRAIETAKLAKLGPVRESPVLNQVYLADIGGMREAGEKGRQFIKTVSGRELAVLVSHVTNLFAISGLNFDSGEMAIVHVDAAGAVVVDGRIKVP